ncbi:hypothetical protein TNCV_107061 [Trichonephila clavipes]|nr:hypothetical protein TNCV_107061 [Trichonephila clavipes]
MLLGAHIHHHIWALSGTRLRESGQPIGRLAKHPHSHVKRVANQRLDIARDEVSELARRSTLNADCLGVNMASHVARGEMPRQSGCSTCSTRVRVEERKIYKCKSLKLCGYGIGIEVGASVDR